MNLEKHQSDNVETSRDSIALNPDARELRDSMRGRVFDLQSFRLERKNILRPSDEAMERAWDAEKRSVLAHDAFPETNPHVLKQLETSIFNFAKEFYSGSVTPYVIAEFFEQHHQREFALAA